MDYKCHIYQIAGIPNMRDVGGYKSRDGRAVAMGRFIRSTALARLDAKGEEQLRETGVDCVIDLRSSLEREHAPDVIENSGDIHYAHIPMLDYISSNFASGNFTSFPKSMHEMYIGLLDKAGESFKQVFGLFADDRFRHYLFHCTAGKDRTGVTAMLLLNLANIRDEIIIEDYSYTRSLLGASPMGAAPSGIPSYVFESSPKTMRITLDHLKEKYGGAAEYLTHIGIGEEKQCKILEKLFG